MSSSTCIYVNSKGESCPFKRSKTMNTCYRHHGIKPAAECLIENCGRYTRSSLGVCSKCVSDEGSTKFLLSRSYDNEKKNKIIEIKNYLAKYAMMHNNPEYSSMLLHTLFDKINDFDRIYGVALDGDDITDYSDSESMTSQALSEFHISTADTDADVDTDTDVDSVQLY